MSLTSIRFTVRNKGGKLGGQTLQHDVPEFNWQTFKNTSNAEAFVKKAYVAAAQKLVRDLHEGRTQTEVHHLQSMESLIARSLKFNRSEIEEWCESREWARAKFAAGVDPCKAIATLKTNLPALANSDFGFPEHLRLRAAEIVAEVADINSDPVADFLFVKLSQEQTGPELELML